MEGIRKDCFTAFFHLKTVKDFVVNSKLFKQMVNVEGLYVFVCLFKEMLRKKKEDKNLCYFHRVDFSGIQNTNWHELVYKLIRKRKKSKQMYFNMGT